MVLNSSWPSFYTSFKEPIMPSFTHGITIAGESKISCSLLKTPKTYNNIHSTLSDAKLHALSILSCGCEKLSAEICITTALLHLLQPCNLYSEVSKCYLIYKYTWNLFDYTYK